MSHIRKLLETKGVTVVYSGTKKTKGVDTGIPAIVVGVEMKLPKNILDAVGVPLIPKSIESILTDVVQTGKITSPPYIPYLQSIGGKLPKAAQDHQGKFRPVPGGVSAIEFCSTGCTTTCWVWSKTQQIPVLLQCWHCSKMENCPGGYITQPSPIDGGVHPDDDIATYLAGSIDNPTTDSGISQPLLQSGLATRAIFELRPYSGYGVPAILDSVTKSGRTTGLSTGTVLALDGAANVQYPDGVRTKEDLIVTTAMLQGGDSSSPLMLSDTSDSRLMGQGFAGSDAISLFVKIPNIIADPSLAPYDLDFDYDFEGTTPPPTPPPNPTTQEYLVLAVTQVDDQGNETIEQVLFRIPLGSLSEFYKHLMMGQ